MAIESITRDEVLADLAPYFEQAAPPPDAFTIMDVLAQHPDLDAEKARKVLDGLVKEGKVVRLGRFPGCGYHQFYQMIQEVK